MSKRITMVISSMGPGGGERVMSVISNYWAAKGWNVTLLTFTKATTSPFYDLDKRIRYLPLDLMAFSSNFIYGILNNIKRISVLRRSIQQTKPDVIISFIDITNIITLLAAKWLKIPIMVLEVIDIKKYPLSWWWERLRFWTYPWADQVVVMNERDRDCFSPKIQKLISVIPNPVIVDGDGKENLERTFPKPFLVAMGRLTDQKGFDILINAFAQIKDCYQKLSLVILGEGPLRKDLGSLVEKLNLTNRVLFAGIIKKPYHLIKQAEFFILPSRYEGFPMALCEAMANGLPVISTEYHRGVREIIDDGVNGLLVPTEDVDALAAAMDRLMGDEAERKRLGTKAEDIVLRFGLEKVMNLWEDLIESVQSKGKK